ncbi:MAG: OmpA family protein, partial [Chitinophagales bacterium]
NADGNSSCYEGQVMVKKDSVVPPLYVLRENGTHAVLYGKFDESFYHQAATKYINYKIDLGMSAAFMLVHEQKARLFFIDFLNQGSGALVTAPSLSKKGEEVKTEDLNKIKVSAKSIQFETGKAELTQNSLPLLNLVAELIQNYPNNNWAIDGYTDNVGTAQSNAILSGNRAQAVADYLVKKGVAADNLYVNGHGEEMPIADNSTADGRKQNRRGEIKPIQ